MDYFSTRGDAPIVGFGDVLLAGLAPDGGLYMPARWPSVSIEEIASFESLPYTDVAAAIVSRFTEGFFDRDTVLGMARKVYARFDHPSVAPVTRVNDDDFILELFHGPTLAFKDFAMQLLGAMFDDALARRDKKLTIIAATSGDTGAAAIEALKRCARIDIVVLHPLGRVTDVQRRMMTTVDAPNVQNIAVEGSFDDCQAIVKTLFADAAFVNDVSLSGVNSINWARLAAQTAYYFSAYAGVAEPGERVSFVVPTGNFGDVFAGYAAKRMGLPIDKLGVATNANDILHRALTTGDYSPAPVQKTASPSMDIQIASNFERLLFEAAARDGAALAKRMEMFKSERALQLSDEEATFISQDFVSCAVSEEETRDEMRVHQQATGAVIDPHTAVGRRAARRLRKEAKLSGKIVTLSTAHPAKFPDAVLAATGKKPQLPDRFADLFERAEHMTTAPNDAEAVKNIILNRFGDAS